MNKIKSPVTGSYNTKVIKWYTVDHFVNLYKTSIDIDVSRFFKNCERVGYVKCLDTNYKFFYPNNILGDDLFYEELQKFEWYYHAEKWEFEEALNYIKVDDKVLEIGAGNGSFLNKLANKKENIEALEFNKSAIESLNNQGYKVYKETIENYSIKHDKQYDVLVTFQVLEHVADVKSFLEGAIKVLKKGGNLIISVPNDSAWILRFDPNLSVNYPPHHMGHLNEEFFINMQQHFSVKLLNVMFEPLSIEQYSRYYRVLAVHIRTKFGFFGKALDKLLYPVSEKLIKTFSRKLKGQSMVVIFTKE